MTSRGRHRTQPHNKLFPFMWGDSLILHAAVTMLEAKGYEVRQVRLTVEDHGHKTTVALHLSPAPDRGISNKGQYSAQSVGKTARRNLETLLAYVEGLPDVRQADPQVDPTGGGTGVHDGTAQRAGEGGA